MVEYIPAARMRADSSGIAAEFSRRVAGTLALEELVGLFAELAALEGATGHACFALRGAGRSLLFGAPADDAGEVLAFPLAGWDGDPYEVEITLRPGARDVVRSAELHAMAALLLARGLALLEAQDDASAAGLPGLTPIEAFCLEERRKGQCDLDIGEALDRSAQAVRVHIERAERKLRPAIL